MFSSHGAGFIMFLISLIIQAVFLGLGTYFFVISLFAWFNRKERPQLSDKTHTYALIVAAHNEERVIAKLVESLGALNYEKSAYDIFVVADNCTDETAAIARAAGAEVYERKNDSARGKGYALEYMFNILKELPRKYDSVAIFDADNIVHPDFLIHMNKRQNQGYRVVQGYIDSKNPFDSWITSSYSIAFWSINKLFQFSRFNLGLSCQLCGTGFVIDTAVLREIGWQATCLTEDMEFTMRLVLHDYIVAWSHEAIVFDEKPLTLSQSWHQRIRWMQGHADVASRYIPSLIKKAVKDKKWKPVDCALYLLQPVRILSMGIITLMAWLQNMYPDGDLHFFQIWYLFPSPFVWNLFVLSQFAYTPLIIWLEKRQFNKKLLWAYFTYFFYSLTWVPIAVLGIVNKNKRVWFHTQHTRKIGINDLNKA